MVSKVTTNINILPEEEEVGDCRQTVAECSNMCAQIPYPKQDKGR